MNLKVKIAIFISALFSVIFAVSAIIIYFLFSDIRREEFENRLSDKAENSIRLISEIEKVDHNLLKYIDRNSIYKLFNEKTLIFNKEHKLIYSSLDDTRIDWDEADLDYLETQGKFFREQKENEVIGLKINTSTGAYFAIVSAYDETGKYKLSSLFRILTGVFAAFTLITWLAAFLLVKRLLRPLDLFHGRIKDINESNLGTRIEESRNKDEIGLLAHEFNQMLQRIDLSYQTQKEFTSHASHELRTPIARSISMIENRMDSSGFSEEQKNLLRSVLSNLNRIAELSDSLLMLSRTENPTETGEPCRIDEIIYDAAEECSRQCPGFKLQMDMNPEEAYAEYPEIKGVRSLLRMAFGNLFRNAWMYSDDKTARVHLSSNADGMTLRICNNGRTIPEEDRLHLFEPFMRGSNSSNKDGLGLGLCIVSRILLRHNAVIRYEADADNANCFIIRFAH